jgi:hypothetical protein
LARAITGTYAHHAAHVRCAHCKQGVLTAAAAAPRHRAAAASTDAARHLRTAPAPLLGTGTQRGIRHRAAQVQCAHCK